MTTLKARTSGMDAAIGRRLKRARMAAGKSQKALADHHGITFQQVQKYENGKNRISASALVLTAEFLAVSALYLLRGDERDTGPEPAAREEAHGLRQTGAALPETEEA